MSTTKYYSHTYTINEITSHFIQFLSIYIQNDDILIEIYLNIVSYHQFIKDIHHSTEIDMDFVNFDRQTSRDRWE